MRSLLSVITIIYTLILFGITPVFATQLIMIDQQGCEWCELWDEEIAEVYPKTEEGKKAPLVRYDIQDLPLENYALAREVHFTPTFIVIENAKEVGRIEGYPGEEFFWQMLDQILNNTAKE